MVNELKLSFSVGIRKKSCKEDFDGEGERGKDREGMKLWKKHC